MHTVGFFITLAMGIRDSLDSFSLIPKARGWSWDILHLVRCFVFIYIEVKMEILGWAIDKGLTRLGYGIYICFLTFILVYGYRFIRRALVGWAESAQIIGYLLLIAGVAIGPHARQISLAMLVLLVFGKMGDWLKTRMKKLVWLDFLSGWVPDVCAAALTAFLWTLILPGTFLKTLFS